MPSAWATGTRGWGRAVVRSLAVGALLAGLSWLGVGRAGPATGAVSASARRATFLACPAPVIRAGALRCDGAREPADMEPPPDVFARLDAPIDPNRASIAALDSLPGVGPVLAERIVRGRPYAGPTDLLRVRGIGPRRLGAMAPRLRFAGAPR